ncbi:DUF4177 domain-containing protein [Paenibacillus sp. SAF-054]|uniref:DUF4177 domain-containing protein n=1 Tax=unclassified Paenibacillus TaxID=185978 RepID=UPI003F7D2C2D
MDQWAYKTVKYSTGGLFGGKVDEEAFENLLNSYGFDGWELVSCFDTNYSQGQSRDVIAIFKRKV